MESATSPVSRSIRNQRTLPALFETSAARFDANIVIWEKREGAYQGTTYADFRDRVHQCAAGLLSLGLRTGDRAALLSEGRDHWLLAELAIFYVGAVCVPLSVKLEEPAELAFRLSHSGARMIAVSGSQLRKMRDVQADLPELEFVITFDAPETPAPGVVTLSEVMRRGEEYLRDHPDAIENLWRALKESDPATISYTSGTTADPKGIVLTHRNYTANVEQCVGVLPIPETYRSLLILPWDHSFAHTAGLYLLIARGGAIASVQVGKTPAETLRNIPVNIREFKPTFLFSVPALARNFRKNIEAAIRQRGPFVEGLFRQALRIAYVYNADGWNRGRGLRKLLKPALSVFDRMLFRKIREGFGGELEFFIGGGALLDIELQRFFYALGLPMLQGYGLTEAAPVISANVLARHKLGSSGHIVPDLEVRVCDSECRDLPRGTIGEIVVRGENVMAGYWKNESATRQAIRDGWLFTGDLGYVDEDDFLYVMGRVKSLLISNDGEKYSPEGIEEALVANSEFIDQIMLYNNQSPYTVALLAPHRQNLHGWLKAQGLSCATPEGQSAALKLLESEIDQYCSGGKFEGMFPSKWLPAAFAVLEEGFTEQNRLLNATLKMVRGRIVEVHQERLDGLFTSEGKVVVNPPNMSAIARLNG